MLILMTPMLHGCVSASSDVWCLTNVPRQPTEAEYAGMDRQSRERMRTHNAYGAKRCGWTP
jgi:hypothetical protein